MREKGKNEYSPKIILLNVVIVIIFAFIIPKLIMAFHNIPAPIQFLSSDFEGKEVVSYYFSLLSFIGTVFLGLVALQQNKIYKEDCDNYQNKIDTSNSAHQEVIGKLNAITSENSEQIKGLALINNGYSERIKESAEINSAYSKQIKELNEISNQYFLQIEKLNNELLLLNKLKFRLNLILNDYTYIKHSTGVFVLFIFNNFSTQQNVFNVKLDLVSFDTDFNDFTGMYNSVNQTTTENLKKVIVDEIGNWNETYNIDVINGDYIYCIDLRQFYNYRFYLSDWNIKFKITYKNVIGENIESYYTYTLPGNQSKDFIKLSDFN